MVDGLKLIADMSFIISIMNYQRPPKFKLPILESYDGTKDLINCVQTFSSHMIFL